MYGLSTVEKKLSENVPPRNISEEKYIQCIGRKIRKKLEVKGIY